MDFQTSDNVSYCSGTTTVPYYGPAPTVCPHCGRCRHCGQGAQPQPLTLPNIGTWPTYPAWPPTVTTTSGASSNLNGASSGVVGLQAWN